MMTKKKLMLAWKYRKQLWKYRRVLAHRRKLAAAATAGAAILAAVMIKRVAVRA